MIMTSQWLVGGMPPPPGVEPNFIDPYDHMSENIALHSTLLTITTLAVGMRLYTRAIITKAKLGVDDCEFYWAACGVKGFSEILTVR